MRECKNCGKTMENHDQECHSVYTDFCEECGDNLKELVLIQMDNSNISYYTGSEDDKIHWIEVYAIRTKIMYLNEWNGTYKVGMWAVKLDDYVNECALDTWLEENWDKLDKYVPFAQCAGCGEFIHISQGKAYYDQFEDAHVYVEESCFSDDANDQLYVDLMIDQYKIQKEDK